MKINDAPYWLRLLWRLGIKGTPCKCSFYRISHYSHKYEFDMESYACEEYRP